MSFKIVLYNYELIPIPFPVFAGNRRIECIGIPSFLMLWSLLVTIFIKYFFLHSIEQRNKLVDLCNEFPKPSALEIPNRGV